MRTIKQEDRIRRDSGLKMGIFVHVGFFIVRSSLLIQNANSRETAPSGGLLQNCSHTLKSQSGFVFPKMTQTTMETSLQTSVVLDRFQIRLHSMVCSCLFLALEY